MSSRRSLRIAKLTSKRRNNTFYIKSAMSTWRSFAYCRIRCIMLAPLHIYYLSSVRCKYMSDLILCKPSKNLQQKIWQYRQECLDFGETRIKGSCVIGFFNDFDQWLEVTLSIEKDKLSRENVHASTFFSLKKYDNKIIGSIQLRHSLTDELAHYGGHIGYEIRPTERRKGYAKQQLQLILDVARDMKIPRVMISCEKENTASAKTAISCGGVLTNENDFNHIAQRVYWIDLTK